MYETVYRINRTCGHNVISRINPDGDVFFQHACSLCGARREPKQVQESKEIPLKKLPQLFNS